MSENNTQEDTTQINVTNQNTAESITENAANLRTAMGAVKLSFNWIGTQRKLSDDIAARAAETFEAQTSSLIASKKLFDTKNNAYKALTAIKSQAQAYWRKMTLPFPQQGIRLMRQADIPAFEAQMADFKQQLEDAVHVLQQEYENIKQTARETLGQLYNENDYPTSLENIFAIYWEYPNVDAPQYLMAFSPELYRQEQLRAQQRFEDAVLLAENAFAEELQTLVEHLLSRLEPGPTGEQKKFNSSTITKFQEFADNFRRMNVRSNAELNSLIDRAASIVQGVDAKMLRTNGNLRSSVKEGMTYVKDALDSLVENAPSRRLILED